MGFWNAVASAGPYANNLHLLQTGNYTNNSLITQFFTGRMLFLMPNRQCQNTEGTTSIMITTTTISKAWNVSAMKVKSQQQWHHSAAMPLQFQLLWWVSGGGCNRCRGSKCRMCKQRAPKHDHYRRTSTVGASNNNFLNHDHLTQKCAVLIS